MKKIIISCLIFILACGNNGTKSVKRPKRVDVWAIANPGPGQKAYLSAIMLFNDDGRKIAEQQFNESNKQENKVEYKYNSRGKVVEDIEYDENDNVKFIVRRKYNSLDSNTAILIYKSNGELDFKQSILYNAKGLNYMDVAYNADKTLKFKDIYSYDSLKREIKWVRYKANDSIELTVFKRYSGNRRIDSCTGIMDGKYEYKFDKVTGQTLEETGFSIKEKVFLWLKTYEYDKEGKLIKEIKYNSLKHRPGNPAEIKIYKYCNRN